MKLHAPLISLLLAVAASQADTLLQYNFPNRDALYQPTEAHHLLSAQNLELGKGIQAGASSALGATGRSLLFDNCGFNSPGAIQALANNDYIAIPLQVLAGRNLSLETLRVHTLRRDLDLEGNSAPNHVAVFCSADEFQQPLNLDSIELQTGDARLFTLHTVDLSSLRETNEIEFRIVFWNNEGIGTPKQRKIRIDDIQVTGGIVVEQSSQTGDWYTDSWIHSHISLSLPPSDLDFIARQIEQAGVDAVQFHTHNHILWNAVRKAKLDKKLNFKMVSTINSAGTWYSKYDNNPDYIYRIHPDGSFAGRWTRKHLCFNAPVVRNEVIPKSYKQRPSQLQPDQVWIDECVITVNLCWCEHCTALYKQMYLSDPPTELTGNNHAAWEQWVQFHRDSFTRWMKDVETAIHSDMPKTLVTFNHAWFMEQPETPPEFIKNLSADIHNDHLELGLYARYGGSASVPFDLMPGIGDDIWAGIHPKSLDKIYNDVALITAHSGRWNIGEYPTTFTKLRAEPKYQGNGYRRADIYFDLAKKGAQFARERQAFCQNTTPVPGVAVLHSARTHYNHVIKNTTTVNRQGGYGMTSDGTLNRSDTGTINSRVFWPNNKPVYDNVIGAYESLLENHIHFNFITEDQLQQSLNGVRLLVLPEQHLLEDATVAAIRQYVASGGALLATGCTLDAGLSDLFGVNTAAKQNHLQVRIGSETIELDSTRTVQPTTAKVLETFADTTTPWITRHNNCIYIAGDLFQEYFDHSGYSYKPTGNANPLREYCNDLYTRLLPGNGVKMSASPWIEMTLRKNAQDNLLVHLINRRVNWKQAAGPNLPVQLSIPAEQPPQTLTLQPAGTPVPFKYINGRIELQLKPEQIPHHQILEINQNETSKACPLSHIYCPLGEPCKG